MSGFWCDKCETSSQDDCVCALRQQKKAQATRMDEQSEMMAEIERLRGENERLRAALGWVRTEVSESVARLGLCGRGQFVLFAIVDDIDFALHGACNGCGEHDEDAHAEIRAALARYDGRGQG